MSKYKRYKKDSTIERKVLMKFNLGGLLDKAKDLGEDYGKFALNRVPGVDVGDSYNNQIFSTMEGINSKIDPVKDAASGMALAGTGATQLTSQFNPQDELQQQQFIEGNSPVRVAKCGGKLKRYQDGGTLLKEKYDDSEFLNWWMTNKDENFTNWLTSVEGEDSEQSRGRHLLNTDREKIYDYQKAWRSGDRPMMNEADSLYHWGSTGKGKDHPTKWKQEYLDEYGVNPDTIDVKSNQSKLKPSKLRDGGKLSKYQDGGLTEYNGLTHEQGGLPINNSIEVEDNETRKGDFVYSDSIDFDKNNTFAMQSKKINNKYSLRPNDKFSTKSRDMELEKLAKLQEALKPEQGIDTTMMAKFGGNINPITGRIKAKFGLNSNKDFDPTGATKYNTKEELEAKYGKDNIKYDSKQNIYYAELNGVKVGYVPEPSKELGEFSNKAALDIMKKEYLTDPKTVRRGWGDQVLKEFDAWVATKDKGYFQPEEKITEPTIKKPETTITETKPQLAATDREYTTPEVNPLTPDYAGIIGSAIPGLASGIGNLALANQIDYDRVSPDQVRLQHLDPTRDSQEIRGSAAGANEDIRQNARGISSYLTNRLGSSGIEQRGLSDVYSKYDNANTQIDNRERELNFNARERASYSNAAIQQQEKQDILGAKARAYGQFAQAGADVMGARQSDLRFRQLAPLLQPDYTLSENKRDNIFQPKSYSAVYRGNGTPENQINGFGDEEPLMALGGRLKRYKRYRRI